MPTYYAHPDGRVRTMGTGAIGPWWDTGDQWTPTGKQQILDDSRCAIPDAQLEQVNVNGNLTLSSGEIVQGKMLNNAAVWLGEGAVLRDCVINMRAATDFTAAINAWGVQGWTVDRVEVRVPTGNRSHFNAYAFQGAGGTLRRFKHSGTVDGVYIVGVNQTAAQTLVEGVVSLETTYYEGPGVHPSDTKTHGDNITLDGNAGKITLRHAVIAPANSAGLFQTLTQGRTWVHQPLVEHIYFEPVNNPAGVTGSYLNIHTGAAVGMELRDVVFPLGTSPARMVIPPSVAPNMVWTSHGPRRPRYVDGSYPVPYWHPDTGNVTTYGEPA